MVVEIVVGPSPTDLGSNRTGQLGEVPRGTPSVPDGDKTRAGDKSGGFAQNRSR